MKKGLKIVLGVLLLVAFGCLGWFGHQYLAKDKCKAQPVDNCMDYYDNNETTEEGEKQESEWKSLGTDISKIQDIFDVVNPYSYSANRARGGLSFFDRELFGIAASHISKSDVEKVRDAGNSYVYYGTVSEEKIFSIIYNYFGDSYNVDASLNYDYGTVDECISNYDAAKNSGHYNDYRVLGNGYLFSIVGYSKTEKKFIVYYYGADGTSGPQPKIETKKVVAVYEKDDIIKVEQRAIYITSSSHNDSVYYEIFSTPQHSIYLGSRNLKYEGIENQVISVDDYPLAATITSIYKRRDDGTYYFASSEISDKLL